MSLHIKSLQVRTDDATFFVALTLVVIPLPTSPSEIAVQARISRTKKGARETLLGACLVNRFGELVGRPEAVTESERDAIERAIREAVGS